MARAFHRHAIRVCTAMCVLTWVMSGPAISQDAAPPTVNEFVGKVIEAAGGNDKLLTHFRMEERFDSHDPGQSHLGRGSLRRTGTRQP